MGGVQLVEASSYVSCPVKRGIQLFDVSSYVRCPVI